MARSGVFMHDKNSSVTQPSLPSDRHEVVNDGGEDAASGERCGRRSGASASGRVAGGDDPGHPRGDQRRAVRVRGGTKAASVILAESLAALIREARGDRSQADVARALGYQQAWFSRIEGGRLPSLVDLRRLIVELDMDPLAVARVLAGVDGGEA